MNNWLVNGSGTERIEPDDRGIAYGDGLFETVAVRNGAARFLELHLKRLAGSCARLAMTYPGDEVLRRDIQQLTNSSHGTLKIILTRGRGPRGYKPPPIADQRVTRMLGFAETEATAAPSAVRVRYCQVQLGRNPALAGLKTLNRLENVLARAEWNDPDIAEGLMLTDRGDVVCGTMSNLFVVREGCLQTPRLAECGVKGVMREQIMRVAAANDISVQETNLSKADLLGADDIFLSNSLIGVWSVGELESQRYQRSDLVRDLLPLLAAAGVSECAA